MLSKPKNWLILTLLASVAYLGLGSFLYVNARFTKALIHTSSYTTIDDNRIAVRHGVEAGEYRLDGLLYLYLLYPFKRAELAYWHSVEPIYVPEVTDISPQSN